MQQTAPDAGGDQSAESRGTPPDPQAQPGDRPSQTERPPQRPAGEPRTAQTRPPARKKPGPTVVARYGLMRQVGQFRHNLDDPARPGTQVVVRTERGVELGEVITDVGAKTCYGCVETQHLLDYLDANGPDYPFRRDGKLLRLANAQDVIDHRHLENSAREEGVFCRRQIRELDLGMKLVTVEHLLGGERIIFYFAAESRVDFRELVRGLAGQYRTRIEMRQVGARDEARLVGDYERCGLRCCCQQFIKDLKPVAMRMAKTQKATLDPSKISGRCGRLMCCLRFEDASYEELRKKLPRRNTWIRTERLVGRVVQTHILSQLVNLELPDRTSVVVANEEIRERDVPPSAEGGPPAAPEPKAAPPPPPEPPARQAPPAAVPQIAPPAPDIEAPEPEPTAAVGGETTEPASSSRKPKRRRRRRPQKKAGTPQGQTQPTTAPGAPGGSQPAAQGDSKQAGPSKRRRRRRRKKR